MGLGTGILRLVTDRHWASDVFIGGAIGFAVGYVIPYLHFTLGDETAVDDAGVRLAPFGDASTAGLGLRGRF